MDSKLQEGRKLSSIENGISRSPVAREASTLFGLALPLMGTQIAQMGMGLLDTIMAGRYSATDLAGVALGSSILWPLMLLVMGIIQAVTPTVSQLNGAKNHKEIGEVIRQGLWIALTGGLLISVILNQIGFVYELLDVDPTATPIAIAYLQMTSLGLPAVTCFFCLRFLAEGMNFTKPALYIALCGLVIKAPLNYVLIYGKLGLPELGGVGCGIAQAIIMWFQLIAILVVVTRPRFDKTGWRSKFSPPNWSKIRPLLQLGIPIGATIFAEMGLFALTTLLLGRYGAEVVASHNIAMSINGLFFMPALALGMASTIRIGFRIGAGEQEQARTTAGIALGSTMCIALAGSVNMFFFRTDIVSAYTTEVSVLSLASKLLLFVVFFLVFDACQSTCLGILRGYKDTKVPLLIALLSFWLIGLPVGCTLGFGLLSDPMQVFGFWVGLAAGVISAAVFLSLRVNSTSLDIKKIELLSHGGN